MEKKCAPGSPAHGEAGKGEPVVKKARSPTALLLKFPPESALPSVAELKARFTRFGLLQDGGSGTQVSPEARMTMVIYDFRSDAEVALNYANNHDMFGQLRDGGVLMDLGDSSPLRAGPVSTPGTSSGASVAAVGQPKSILKKRSASGDGASGAAGGAPRAARRVKFFLDAAGDSEPEPPAPP